MNSQQKRPGFQRCPRQDVCGTKKRTSSARCARPDWRVGWSRLLLSPRYLHPVSLWIQMELISHLCEIGQISVNWQSSAKDSVSSFIPWNLKRGKRNLHLVENSRDTLSVRGSGQFAFVRQLQQTQVNNQSILGFGTLRYNNVRRLQKKSKEHVTGSFLFLFVAHTNAEGDISDEKLRLTLSLMSSRTLGAFAAISEAAWAACVAASVLASAILSLVAWSMNWLWNCCKCKQENSLSTE